jgi:hypothetical protein
MVPVDIAGSLLNIITAGFSIRKAAIFSRISRPATAKLVRIGFLPNSASISVVF